MLLAVTAGLKGRLEELFSGCARLEGATGRRIAAILQLGDLPLRHDFSRRGGPRPVVVPGSLVADLLHRRKAPPCPLVFLAGEEDDPELLASPAASVVEATPTRRLDLALSDAAPLCYLRSGAVVNLQMEGEEVAVGGLSAFGGAGRGRRPPRSDTRELLQLEPGALPLLLAHDSPERFLDGGTAPPAQPGDAEHPGRMVLKMMERLRPRLLIHGHGAGEARVREADRSTIVSLPPWPRSGPPGVVALVDSADWSVQFPGELSHR